MLQPDSLSNNISKEQFQAMLAKASSPATRLAIMRKLRDRGVMVNGASIPIPGAESVGGRTPSTWTEFAKGMADASPGLAAMAVSGPAGEWLAGATKFLGPAAKFMQVPGRVLGAIAGG